MQQTKPDTPRGGCRRPPGWVPFPKAVGDGRGSTGGADGRAGNDTMLAVRNFQLKVGLEPADGYAGITLLARLRLGL